MRLRLPQSLRARPPCFLMPAVLATAVVQNVAADHAARAEEDEIFDFQMQQMAAALRSGVTAPDLTTPRAESDDNDGFGFVVEV